MIRADGWTQYSIWEHSATVRDLYAQRCRLEAEEMTCHAQAAELLVPYVKKGDTLLDVGCGSGYFFHSLRVRAIPVEYWGIDASQTLLEIGRIHLPGYGLPSERLLHVRLEDLSGEVDHVVCINVLSNLDNYQRHLERMLHCARKTLILRESFASKGHTSYVGDKYLDQGCDLRVHVNTYPTEDVLAFIKEHGFTARTVTDRRTGGAPEMVIGYPHHWTFIEAKRQ